MLFGNIFSTGILVVASRQLMHKAQTWWRMALWHGDPGLLLHGDPGFGILDGNLGISAPYFSPHLIFPAPYFYLEVTLGFCGRPAEMAAGEAFT